LFVWILYIGYSMTCSNALGACLAQSDKRNILLTLLVPVVGVILAIIQLVVMVITVYIMIFPPKLPDSPDSKNGDEAVEPPPGVVPGPSVVQSLPPSFKEEVERAQAANSKGWLRLLAQDVRGRSFQLAGLQVVATAQWKLKDYEGARENAEEIRKSDGDNVVANLILANIYQRLSRDGERPEFLIVSDQAIERVLASDKATALNRVEALALKGRNQKTRWRNDFEKIATLNGRRAAAMNQALRKSYEAYREAFAQDYNHYYSGLNALQMAMIFLDLSKGEDDAWKLSFKDNDEADDYRRKLDRDVKNLQPMVSTAVETALNELASDDPERIWAEISDVDLLFLTEENAPRVIRRYQDILPRDNLFAWDAVKGQLQLFAALGIKENLAHDVISALDGRYTQQEQKPVSDKPLQIVFFAGHRVDTPGRVPPRFPPDKEDRAREQIRDALSKLNQGVHLEGLASGAPGADILFHEVCDELNIPSTLCLPMPTKDYLQLAFEDLDNWRTRFLNLKQKKKTLELSDRNGLPEWLEGTSINFWERGNSWVLQMAVTMNAARFTLLALWDGKDGGNEPGGTAHMVELAKREANVYIEIIDAAKLLQ
jgi:hypothetical protein